MRYLLHPACWLLAVVPLINLAQTQRAPIVLSHVQVSFSSVSEQPLLVGDGRGGVYVVFRSTREGRRFGQLFAQHVLPDGRLAWGSQGIAIADDSLVHLNHKVMSDGQDGLWVIWEGKLSGATTGRWYVARIRPDGTFQSAARLLSEKAFAATDLAITTDHEGGFFAVWAEGASGPGVELWAQHINGSGNDNWGPSGKPVMTEAGQRRNLQLTSTPGKGICVVWEDFRNLRWEVYGMALDEQGNRLWPEKGISFQMPGQTSSQTMPFISSDGYGGMVVAYCRTDPAMPGQQLMIARYNRQGYYRYHRVVADGYGNRTQPRMVCRANEAYLVWEDTRFGGPDLYFAKIGLEDGEHLLSERIIPISSSPTPQTSAQVFFTFPIEGFTVSWLDLNGEHQQLLVQQLNTAGAAQWGVSGTMISTFSHRTAVSAAGDERGGAWFAWVTPDGIPVLQHLNDKGLAQFPAKGFSVTEPSGAVLAKLAFPQVAEGLHQDTYIAYEDYRAGERSPQVYLQRLGKDGKPAWPVGGIRVAKQPGAQELPKVVALPRGACVGWTHRLPGGDENLYLQFIDSNGQLLGPPEGYRLCTAARSQTSLRLCRIGYDDVLAVWTDARTFTASGFDIFYQRMDAFGNQHLGPDGALLAPAKEYQVSPDLVEDGRGGAFIVWMDQRGGTYQLYGQHLSRETRFLWPAEGIRICPTAENQRYPRISRVQDQIFVTWSEDFARNLQSRAYVQALQADGSFVWGKTPRPLTLTYGSQTMPRIASQTEGVVVGWLDQRHESSSGFNLFLTSLKDGITRDWPENGLSLGKFLPEHGEFALATTPDTRYTYCAWSEQSTDRALVQYARIASASGSLLWRQHASPSPFAQVFPCLTHLGNGKVAALWINQSPDNQVSTLVLWPLD